MEILTKFSNDLRILGYNDNASFRAKVIQSAITGFWRQVEASNPMWGLLSTGLRDIRERRGATRSSLSWSQFELSASSLPLRGAGW